MINAFRQNPRLDNEEIFLIYNDFAQRTSKRISYEKYLESFIIYLRSKVNDYSFVNSTIEHVKPILNKEKKEKPYSNVDEQERRLLLAIDQAIRNDETSSVPNNLHDLSLSIQKTQCELKQTKKINRWSISISVVSVVLSIISMFLGYFSSQSDVDRISSGIVKQLLEQKINIIEKDNVQ